jgi:hypothetical protein
MLAHTAHNVLNTQQGLEHIKELWPLVIRISYILSTLHLQGCIQPKTGSTYFNTLHSLNLPHPPTDSLLLPRHSFNHYNSAQSHIIFKTTACANCCPLRHWVLPGRSGPLSCTSPAQSPNARSCLLPLLAFRSSCQVVGFINLIYLFGIPKNFIISYNVSLCTQSQACVRMGHWGSHSVTQI